MRGKEVLVIGLSTLALVGLGCGEDHSTPEPDASTSAGDASTSAGDASTPEGDASTSEGDASTSAGDASTSAGDASTSAGDASIPTCDTLLASLSLVYADGTLIPTLDTVTSAFTVDVGIWLAEVQVIATPSDSSASITINGTDVAVGEESGPIALNWKETAIQIDVKAPGGAACTYTLTVNRAPEVYAKALDTGFDDNFGYAVSLWGDTLAVGAYRRDNKDTNALDTGGVYVFTRTGTTWSQQAYLTALNAGAVDRFGCAVSLWEDTLVVGACDEDSNAINIGGDDENNDASDSGAVYVFTRTGTAWLQQEYIKASNTEKEDGFGYAVSLWGDTLAVGACEEDSDAINIGGDDNNNNTKDSGAVYVYTRDDDTGWSGPVYIKASNTGELDWFGCAVSLWGDTLAVGAYNEDSNAKDIGGNQGSDGLKDSGAVYVYTRDDTGWSGPVYIKASNTGYSDRFGYAVSLWGDTLAVGAYQEDSAYQGVFNEGDEELVDASSDDNAVDSGAVYIYTRDDTGWSQQAYIKASNTESQDYFGWAVSLHGNKLAVGAHREDSAATGIGGDDTINGASDSGAVYVFTRDGTTWSQQNYLKASNTDAGDFFGYVLSLWGDTVAAGAYLEDSAATGIDGDGGDSPLAVNSGAVYLFQSPVPSSEP